MTMGLGIDNWDQIITPERLVAIGQGLLRVLFVLVVTRVGISLASYAVEKFMAGYKKHHIFRQNPARVETIGALLRSVIRYGLYLIGFLWVLDAIGIRAGSVLAAAGIGGLALGFGAQNLVRDVISGFFILLEGQYEVGEYVTVDGKSGVIAEIGLRSTRIQAFSGDVIYIPNGTITVVTNHSRAPMSAIVDVSFGYGEDHNRAIAVATQALEEFRFQVDYIVDGPKVLGIVDLGESGVKIRVWAKAANGKQWGLERDMRRVVKEAFDREGIEIPFPHRVVMIKNPGQEEPR